MSFYPQRGCADGMFSSPGAIEELREVWYSFLWREDVATPGGAALRKTWRSGVSLMQ
ncbi:hypothetical protein M405DRAFT_807327 [Rhizopogon salebrosus TDB-379]|nr:hypothetical protein M405DRAFT_807323 [Rhizopogon salebrosus TDB-379]KAJ8595408.1 hypothetical protein M405DRAFT_807327 [Rhizopogon salebrosus TDB-379]